MNAWSFIFTALIERHDTALTQGQVHIVEITFSAITFITIVPFMELRNSACRTKEVSDSWALPRALVLIILGKAECEEFA
jgi:hypothetical protein